MSVKNIIRGLKFPIENTGYWQTEELGRPIGEGYGYLIDIETGEFIGIDIGYDVVRKNFTHLKG